MSTSNLSIGLYTDPASSRADGGDARSRWDGRVSARLLCELVRLADAVALIAGALIAADATAGMLTDLGPGRLALLTLLGTAAACGSMARGGLYAIPVLRTIRAQLRIIVVGWCAAILCSLASFQLLGEASRDGCMFVLVWLIASGLLLGLVHGVAGQVVAAWSRNGRLFRRVAIFGSPECSRGLLERISDGAGFGISIVGFYGEPAPSSLAESRLPLRGGIAALLQDNAVQPLDQVVITLPTAQVDQIAAVCMALRACPAEISVLTDFVEEIGRGDPTLTARGETLVQLRAPALTDRQIICKRVFDVAVASLVLVLVLPLLLLTALAIKLDSSGPVLFRQPRTGFNNRMFYCLKFRTMFHNMEDKLADRQTVKGDKRVTRVGAVARKFSVDELPQLFNVLRGEMSIVGPRPHAPNTKAADRLFSEVVENYGERHRVPPGITGWAQVNGWRGETRTIDQIRNRVAFDLFYIENWSLFFDIRILFRTVFREIFSGNAF